MTDPTGHSLPPERAYRAAKPFLDTLRGYTHALTRQQLRTLKGQALAGDLDGAMKGLRNLIYRKETVP